MIFEPIHRCFVRIQHFLRSKSCRTPLPRSRLQHCNLECLRKVYQLWRSYKSILGSLSFLSNPNHRKSVSINPVALQRRQAFESASNQRIWFHVHSTTPKKVNYGEIRSSQNQKINENHNLHDFLFPLKRHEFLTGFLGALDHLLKCPAKGKARVSGFGQQLQGAFLDRLPSNVQKKGSQLWSFSRSWSHSIIEYNIQLCDQQPVHSILFYHILFNF